MYTHSNQRVVGGSKAEELIGRAAVRDVFRRKVYSQLPANHILDSVEVHIALFHIHWKFKFFLTVRVYSGASTSGHCNGFCLK